MDALTIDQFTVFVTIVDTGSFAAAARQLSRAQSAITYAIQKLEEQSGLLFFDRSTYRPTLTAAGIALLPRARRILDDVADWRLHAHGIAQGLEPEISLVIVPYATDVLVSRILGTFNTRFPRVCVHLSTVSFSVATEALRAGNADIGLLTEHEPLSEELERRQCGWIDLVAVAAPDHPLGKIKGKLNTAMLLDCTQLVLGTALGTDKGRDYGVHAVNHWRVSDIQTKRSLILAGVGWGSMPKSVVAKDIAAGRLVELELERWEGSDKMPSFPLVIAHLKDRALGPAGRWLVEQFVS
jgi:DNA-binding transcriptional LysR family regulator